MPKLRNKKTVIPSTFYILVDENGDTVMKPMHSHREAARERRAFAECGITKLIICKYEFIEELP